MPRDDQHRIEDILLHVRKAVAKTEHLRFDPFPADENLHLAFTLHVQIVGEAAARRSQTFKSKRDTLPWRQIIAMRNLLVHDCGGVDYRIVRQVARNDLPALIATLSETD